MTNPSIQASCKSLLWYHTAYKLILPKSMGSVNLVVIVESVQNLITSNGELKEFHIASIAAVAAALGECYFEVHLGPSNRALIGVKFLLFWYCLALRKKSSQVHVLWEDHRNDLFINGFGSCFMQCTVACAVTDVICRYPHVGGRE